MNRFQKLLALTPQQWYLLTSSLLLLPVIKLSLKCVDFRRTYNIFIVPYVLHSSTPIEINDTDLLKAQNIANMIEIAATHGFMQANCLTKSLLLIRILNKQNIACQLMIGANHNTDIINNFSAHAWVESDGKVLNDRSDISTSYQAFSISSSHLK